MAVLGVRLGEGVTGAAVMSLIYIHQKTLESFLATRVRERRRWDQYFC